MLPKTEWHCNKHLISKLIPYHVNIFLHEGINLKVNKPSSQLVNANQFPHHFHILPSLFFARELIEHSQLLHMLLQLLLTCCTQTQTANDIRRPSSCSVPLATPQFANYNYDITAVHIELVNSHAKFLPTVLPAPARVCQESFNIHSAHLNNLLVPGAEQHSARPYHHRRRKT